MRLSIRAQLDRCPRCDAAILRAFTAPPAAWEARTDPAPLDPLAEVRALAAGRMTYDLAEIAGHRELIYRDQHRITQRTWPVLPEHKCPGPIPWTGIPPPLTEVTTELDDEPPF